MAEAVRDLFKSDCKIETIGVREGEKMHETLLTKGEMINSIEHENYYQVRNIVDDYDDFYTHGHLKISDEGYNSENTYQLSKEETIGLLKSLEEIKEQL